MVEAEKVNTGPSFKWFLHGRAYFTFSMLVSFDFSIERSCKAQSDGMQ